MSKLGIVKSKSVKVTGLLNVEDKVIEVEGENLPLEELLKDFDGYNIEIKISNEITNEYPTKEDLEGLGKF